MKSLFALAAVLVYFCAFVVVGKADPAAEHEQRRLSEKIENLKKIEDPDMMEAMMKDIMHGMATNARDFIREFSPEEIEAHRKKVRERRRAREQIARESRDEN